MNVLHTLEVDCIQVGSSATSEPSWLVCLLYADVRLSGSVSGLAQSLTWLSRRSYTKPIGRRLNSHRKVYAGHIKSLNAIGNLLAPYLEMINSNALKIRIK